MNDNSLKLTNLLKEISYIDFNSIINIIAPITITYISGKALYNMFNDYKIYHNSIYQDSINIKLPPQIKYHYSSINKERINTEYYKLIVEFITTLHRYFNKKDLALLHNNIDSLKIIPLKKIKDRQKNMINYTAATYDIETNSIAIGNDYEETIFYELFHLSSSYYDKKNNIIYSGFLQIIDNISIGLGLTEGYTQYLTEKYFLYKHNILESYNYEKNVSKNIEMIVGEEKMNSLYLSANLYGLINELELYNDKKCIYSFINNLDFVSKYYCSLQMSNKKILLTIDKMNQIKKFLLESYFNKLIYDYKDNFRNSPIPSDTELASFLCYMPISIVLAGKKYYLDNLDELKNYISNYNESIKKKLIRLN